MTATRPRRPSRVDVIAAGAICAVAGAYLVARAIRVPLTYDEAASLVRYVQGDAGALLDFGVATNHLLNSVLTRVAHAALGDAPWALRLPSVLAGFVYLASMARLALGLHHRALGLAGLVLVAANPYVLDYLSLSRGYGLALGLLAASLVNLVRWVEWPAASVEAHHHLRRALLWAGLAVAANFSTLVVFLAMAGAAVLRAWWAGPTPAAAPPVIGASGWPWRAVAAWAALAAAFTTLVYARERALSQELFAPITIRAFGLFLDERDQIQVFRVNARGALRALDRAADGSWRTGAVRDAWGLRIELPAAVDQNLGRLEVTIGPHRFERTRRHPGPWRVVDPEAAHRVLEAGPALAAPRPSNPALHDAVNWRGGPGHARSVAGYTIATLAVLALLALSLAAGAVVAVRLRLLPWPTARLVAIATSVVASVVAAPLYLLRRNAQLYFGGSLGVIPDTLGSLLHGTAYGVAYHPAQVPLALGTLAVVAGSAVAGGLWARRQGRAAPFHAPLFLMAIVALTLAQVTLQHHLLGTPYLTGRTAIGLLPLLLWCLVLSLDAVASLARPARALATAVMLALALAAAVHAVGTFNLWRTLDWPEDAATPAMLAAVGADRPAEGVAPRTVRIGTEWMYFPVARYYAWRQSSDAVRYDVHVVPGDEPMPDYLYVQESSRLGVGRRLWHFPESSAVLWRARP